MGLTYACGHTGNQEFEGKSHRPCPKCRKAAQEEARKADLRQRGKRIGHARYDCGHVIEVELSDRCPMSETKRSGGCPSCNRASSMFTGLSWADAQSLEEEDEDEGEVEEEEKKEPAWINHSPLSQGLGDAITRALTHPD